MRKKILAFLFFALLIFSFSVATVAENEIEKNIPTNEQSGTNSKILIAYPLKNPVDITAVLLRNILPDK